MSRKVLSLAREPAAQLFAPLDTEFRVDMREVRFDRSRRKLQALGDVPRRIAECGEQSDLALAAGELRDGGNGIQMPSSESRRSSTSASLPSARMSDRTWARIAGLTGWSTSGASSSALASRIES